MEKVIYLRHWKLLRGNPQNLTELKRTLEVTVGKEVNKETMISDFDIEQRKVKVPMIPLIDGNARHRENPETFEVPTHLEKGSLKEWDLVKIWVEAKGLFSGERFWVQVKAVIWQRRLIVRIDNDLISTKLSWIKYADEIVIEMKNVLSIL